MRGKKRVGGALKHQGGKRKLYQSTVVPTLLYGIEVWVLNGAALKRRLEAVEMSCLREMCGVIMQRILNLEIRCQITKSIIQRVDGAVFKVNGATEDD